MKKKLILIYNILFGVDGGGLDYCQEQYYYYLGMSLQRNEHSNTVTIDEARIIYSKAIAEGIIGGLNLTTYNMKSFDDILREVRNVSK